MFSSFFFRLHRRVKSETRCVTNANRQKSSASLFHVNLFGCSSSSYSTFYNPLRSITAGWDSGSFFFAVAIDDYKVNPINGEANREEDELLFLSYLFFIALLLSGGIFVFFFFFSRLCSSHTEMDSAPPTATTPLGQSLIDPFPSISFDRWQPTAWRSDAASCVFRGLPTSRLILPFFLLLLRGGCIEVCFFFLLLLSSSTPPPYPFPALNPIKYDCVSLHPYTPESEKHFFLFYFFFFTRRFLGDNSLFLCCGCGLSPKQTNKKRIRDPQTVATVRFLSPFFCFCFPTPNFTSGRICLLDKSGVWRSPVISHLFTSEIR